MDDLPTSDLSQRHEHKKRRKPNAHRLKKESPNCFELADQQSQDAIRIEMYEQALKFFNGDGCDVDKKEAARYFQMAADKGHEESMYRYAMMLFDSDEIDIDKNKAAQYFEMAADEGHIESMYRLAQMASM